jgi:hypothetical protein
MSSELLQSIEEAARANLTTKSGFIREAVAMRLNKQHLEPNPRPEDIIAVLKQS